MDNPLIDKNNRQILEKILIHHANIPYSQGNIRTQTVFDHANNHYLLVDIGWDKDNNRAYGSIVHVDIIKNKFWIRYDGTEYGIAKELEDKGISKKNIILAFHPPHIRKYTDYAVT